MNRVNTGFGMEQKKVNPLKVLGIIALILLGVGLFIYIRDYDYYNERYNNKENQEEVIEDNQSDVDLIVKSNSENNQTN